jgi:hypothetical protein
LLNKRANTPQRFESFIFRKMETTIDVLDTVLLNFRISEHSGKFLANLGDDVVEMESLRRDGDGNVWATYWHRGEKVETLHYEARRSMDMIKRTW